MKVVKDKTGKVTAYAKSFFGAKRLESPTLEKRKKAKRRITKASRKANRS